MDTRTLARIAGLAGLATVIGGTVVEALFPAPVEPGGTAEAILRAGSQPGILGTVVLLAATTGLGTALLLVFSGAVARYLDPEYGLLAQFAVLGAFGAFLLSIIRRGLTIAFAQVAGSADQGAVALYVAATDSLVRVYAFPVVLQMGSLGLLIIGRRILPVWTGWTALALAAAMVVGSFVAGIDPSVDFGFPVYIGILVWTAAVSVILLVRSASSTADVSERTPSTAS